MTVNVKKIKHLYARAGFGLRTQDLGAVTSSDISQVLEKLFNAATTPIASIGEASVHNKPGKDDAQSRKMFMQQQRRLVRKLNIDWIKKMSSDDGQLREKMTLFWHNHFACRSKDPFYAQQLNNIHRANALGNFRTMLLEVSKSPAMLQFLNNQQNKKGHPNENFARELMELFTVGRGNYTETDVKESARAFTGWAFDKDGQFVTRQFLHDDGRKTFMGKTGNFTGEDIVDILLSRKETARFICTKLYKYLVNETPDTRHVNDMADVFYNCSYEIAPLLKHVFTAGWFYDDKNIGNLIKSPVELIVGLNRQFGVTYNNPDVLMQFQRALGQVLFYPPNVAGWAGGKNWIDSSSLMYRMKIPSTVLNDGVIDFTGKADPEDEAFLAAARQIKRSTDKSADTQTNWDGFLTGIPQGASKTTIAQVLLAPALTSRIQSIVNKSTDIKAMAIELVSTPEYQLC